MIVYILGRGVFRPVIMGAAARRWPAQQPMRPQSAVPGRGTILAVASRLCVRCSGLLHVDRPRLVTDRASQLSTAHVYHILVKFVTPSAGGK